MANALPRVALRPIILIAWAAAISPLAQPACAQFSYVDFGSTEGLTLVSAASPYSDRLRLAPSASQRRGGAWYATKQPLQNGFDTVFRFQFTQPGGIGGADGMAFVVQNASGMALGGPGSAIGYGGGDGFPGISNSLAVEFDSWPEPPEDHISIQTRGTLENTWDHAYSLGLTTAIPTLNDGSVYTARIRYVPGTMAVYLNDLTQPVLVTPVELSSLLSLDNGAAWVGFTAATGDGIQNHDLLSWDFTPIPEASGMLVAAWGLAGLGAVIRRRAQRL